MRTFLPFCFLLFFATAHAQEQITLKFVRPSNPQGTSEKILLTIQSNEYLIKDGGSISLNINPDFTKSIEIVCGRLSSPEIQTNYFLDPLPNQTYEFEVGLRVNGIFIKLINGEEAFLGNEDIKGKSNEILNENITPTLNEQIEEPATAKERWLKRSGRINYFSLMLTGIYARVDVGKFGKMNGAGIGESYGFNSINVIIPEYQTGKTTWNSFNWGLGFDINFHAFQFNTVQKSGGVTTTNKFSYLTLDLMPFASAGWTYAIGRFTDENTWKGIAFTAKYRPTFNRSLTMLTLTKTSSIASSKKTVTNSDSDDSKFNFAGLGFDADFIKYTCTARKISTKPRAKISVVFLPPIGENPMFVNVSFGMTLYTKKRQ